MVDDLCWFTFAWYAPTVSQFNHHGLPSHPPLHLPPLGYAFIRLVEGYVRKTKGLKGNVRGVVQRGVVG